MENTTIYRIEDDLGNGPYRSGHCEGHNRLYDDYRCPPPFDDPGLKDAWYVISDLDQRPHYRFGFASLEALERWFPARERLLLKDVGMKVAEYTVHRSSTHSSHRQAIFNINHATLVRRQELYA